MSVISVVALLLFLSAQQNSTTQIPTKGTIEGLVLQVGTNDPIAGARVSLARVQGPATAAGPGATPAPPPPSPISQVNPSVNTDAEGKFVLKDLDPGQYRVLVANNGYARTEYGQRVFGAPGTPVSLIAGQTLKDIVVHLTPAGNVSGRIRDLSGRPVVGVQVQLLKASFQPNGQRSFQSAGSTRTNDHGEYRLYWVTPGRYYLNAGSSQGLPVNPGGGGASPNEVQEVYTSTYYPNVTDISVASVLDVRPGVEMSGIDVSIGRQKLYRVRGRVIDSRTGRPPQAATFTLSSRALGGGGVMMVARGQRYNNADGSFDLPDNAPGTYGIGVTVSGTSGLLTSSPNAQQARASAVVTIVDADIENVTMTISAPASLPGRFAIEGQPLTTLTALDRIRVQLSPPMEVGFDPRGQAESQPVAADGTFKIDNLVPGDYRVSVAGIPPGYYVKEARLEQRDVLDQLLHFTETVSGNLEVVISPNGGELNGTVLNDKQQPQRGIQAVLIPDQQRNRTELYKTATSDENGHFTMRGIPPGDYKIYAWEALEQFGYFDSDFVRSFEARSKSLHINEASKSSIEVRIIPAAP